MDFLQIALIFLILLLSIFLAITGIQVFFILRDLKKALDKFNNMLQSGENIVEDSPRSSPRGEAGAGGAGIEKPVEEASSLISSITAGAKSLTAIAKSSKPKAKRFYKRTL